MQSILPADLSRRLPFAARWRSAWCQEAPEITTCNGSLCRQKNALMTKVHESALSVESGEDLLSVYEWKTHRTKPCLLLAPRDLHVPSPARRRIVSASTCSVLRMRLGATVAEDDRTNKNAASVSGSGVLCIRTSKEEDFLSLAGLAATYSPRA
jgi:hypothetical protein